LSSSPRTIAPGSCRRSSLPPCRAARRDVCPLRCVSAATAALDGFVVPRAAHRCFPRLKSSPGTQDRVRLRAPPPSAVTRCRPAACMCPMSSDQDPTLPIQACRLLNPRSPATVRSRSDRSNQSDLESTRSNPASPGDFAEKPLSFLKFTKIPSRRDKILTV
jgi:hypothetical protein